MWQLICLGMALAGDWNCEHDLARFYQGDQASSYPQQIKLAWTGQPGELIVVWVTYAQTRPYLRFRPSGTSDYQLIKGKSSHFQQGDSNYQYINQALITGLEHLKHYEYFVGDYPYISSALNITFYEAGQTQIVAAFGDWGTGSNGKPGYNHMVNLVNKGEIHGILHFGDIAYDLHDENGEIGDQFFREIEPISRQIPYMFTPGNHEDHQNFTQVVNRMRMISNQANQGTGLFFSFDLKYAHIVMLNSEVYFRDGGDPVFAETQYNWLVEDLKQANQNREEKPWLIVLSHHPMYCSTGESFCTEEGPLLKTKWEDLFYENTVDVYFSGHVHWYERDTAIYKNQVVNCGSKTKNSITDAGATVHILSGIIGNHQGKVHVPSNWEPYAEIVENDFGYGVITISSKESLEWVQYDAEKDTVIDTFVLNKTSIRPF